MSEKSLSDCCGCTPASVVTAFCDAIRAFDFERAVGYMQKGYEDWGKLPTGAQIKEGFASAELLLNFNKECVSQMTYNLGETEENGENAAINVSFTYVDASELVRSVMKEFSMQALGMAILGEDEAKITKALEDVFMRTAESVPTDIAVADAAFRCVNIDGEWKITAFSEDTEKTINKIIAGLSDDINLIDALGDNFGEESGSDDGTIDFGEGFDNMTEDEPPAITAWTDVPLGSTAELDTLKICIGGYEEKKELPTIFSEPKTAEDGTKFIVISATLENITDEEICFNNEYVLSDSLGNNYEPYPEISMLEYDETFWFASLEPHVPKRGVLIYNVSEDSDGYYMSAVNNAIGEGFRLYAR